MLVLTRKPGQKILIEVKGVQVLLSVLAVSGRQVRLGMKADTYVSIYREELLDDPSVDQPNCTLNPAIKKILDSGKMDAPSSQKRSRHARKYPRVNRARNQQPENDPSAFVQEYKS